MKEALKDTRRDSEREGLSATSRSAKVVTLEGDEDSVAHAREAGLRYVNDRDPGFRRIRRGRGFSYRDHQNFNVSSDAQLERIRLLAIPPAWQSVWICRFDDGHLQATGRDLRLRKQYRYHSLWSQTRNLSKFDRMATFGELLPKLRGHLEHDLRLPGLPREKVLAAVVRTMEETMIRVGNDIYAKENSSYGLTTIRDHHVEFKRGGARFHFRGKSGVMREAHLHDPRLTRIIRRCQELPGQELFAYVDDQGRTRDVESGDVNRYLCDATGDYITAKDFRTWGASVRASVILSELESPDGLSQRALKSRHKEVVCQTAEYLGNTAAVCKSYYVHPLIFDADVDGRLKRAFAKAKRSKREGLKLEEIAFLKLLGE